MTSTEHVPTSATPPLPPGTKVTTPGPLGPWRLAASVATVAVTSGPQLAAATTSGHQLDQALGRSLAVATVTWLLLGVINRILAHTSVVGGEPGADAADGTDAADAADDQRR